MEQTGSDQLGSLETELDVWRKTAFGQLAARRYRPPALRSAAAQARAIDPAQISTEDIRAMLIAAVAHAEQVQLAPAVRGAEDAAYSPQVIRELFGLTRNSRDVSTRDRQELAGQLVGRGVSWHTIRKNSQAYVEQLARWVGGIAPVPQSHGTSTLYLPYSIPRHAELLWLHNIYRKLSAQHGGLFVLWGLDGTGKTTLTRQFANEVAPRSGIGFIRLGRRGLYEEDVRHVLRLEGVDTSTLSDEHCSALFREVATRFRAIRLLVLDDARDKEEIYALLPNDCNIPVLVTALEHLHFSDLPLESQPPALQLAAISREESSTYFKNELPAVQNEIIRTLASMLGGHVQSMHLVVCYLKSQPTMNPESLVEDIARRAAQALTDLAEVTGAPRSLPAIVQSLYKTIRRDPLADAILTSVAWTHSSGEQPKELIIEIASHLVYRPTPLQIQAAVLRLERSGLLTTTSTSFVVPRLAAHILRDLATSTREPILVAYEQVLTTPMLDIHHDAVLLQILRHEYRLLEPLRASLAKAIGNTSSPTPALLTLDTSNWVLLTTDETGKRRAAMYRTTPEALLRIGSDAVQWEEIAGAEANLIANLASRVYPTIRTGLIY